MEMDGVYIRRDTDLPQIYLSTIVLLAAQLSSLCEEEVGIGRMQQRLCVWKETVRPVTVTGVGRGRGGHQDDDGLGFSIST
ncbi:Os08g0170001 [Oryza sativa Japonica Group]|uniref:Os08g0170001 protein n=3 Tax=Oryza TaxID=4527 RepID=A0A0P0XCI5_ORYSJ|nr:Os08g0170001 [Oryza sativa Japonica Group]